MQYKNGSLSTSQCAWPPVGGHLAGDINQNASYAFKLISPFNTWRLRVIIKILFQYVLRSFWNAQYILGTMNFYLIFKKYYTAVENNICICKCAIFSFWNDEYFRKSAILKDSLYRDFSVLGESLGKSRYFITRILHHIIDLFMKRSRIDPLIYQNKLFPLL